MNKSTWIRQHKAEPPGEPFRTVAFDNVDHIGDANDCAPNDVTFVRKANTARQLGISFRN